LKINSQTADAFANHARVLNALRRFDQAIAACDRALAINSMLLPAHVSRGIALKEWKGAGVKTKLLVALSLLVLVTSTVVVGYGNYLGAQPPAATSSAAFQGGN